MKIGVFSVACFLSLLSSLMVSGTVFAADGTFTLLDEDRPLEWQSDGMWQVRAVDDSVEFLKDERPMHNSMCWTKLDKPLKPGDTVEITYRMEVPFKHVDLVLGNGIERPDADKPMPEFDEVLSLGGIKSTGWQTKRVTVTASGDVNMLGFLSWGWQVDRGTWMRVARMRVIPSANEQRWHVWHVGPSLNDRSVSSRSPLQDFFPFGVYLPVEFSDNFVHEGMQDRWEWFDTVLADIASRGMNFTSVTNLTLDNLDRLAELHKKHGLRMNPQLGEINAKYVPERAMLKRLTQTVAAYRDRNVIAGWAVGEEFKAEHIPLLDLPYELIPAIDPDNSHVLIQHNTEVIRAIGERYDVRILWRDIYPFFADAHHGPTTFAASLNYYEDELDKNQRLLPQGASLCAMPQAQSEFYGGRYVYRKPTPAEIRLQAWAALSRGAKGIAYFLYPSKPPGEDGQPSPMEGLRLHDGTATPQLEAITDLAKRLVPHGSTIVKWERSRAVAASDHAALRAYMFRGDETYVYAVVYNRGVEADVEGRVRLPLVTDHVTDLLHDSKLDVSRQGLASEVAVRLAPGDGTILRIKGQLIEPTTHDHAPGEENVPHIAGRPRPDVALKRQPDGHDLFDYYLNLAENGVPAGEVVSEPIRFRKVTQAGQTYQSGVYGGVVTMQFTMPRDIESLSILATHGNYADGRERVYQSEYSVDGKTFESLANVTAGGGITKVEGATDMPGGVRRVWIRCTAPDHNPSVVLHGVRVKIRVASDPDNANPDGEVWVSGRPEPSLSVTDLPDGRKLIRYTVDVQKNGGLPEGHELSGSVRFQDHDRLGFKYQAGLRGRAVLLRFDVPGSIDRIEAEGVYGNHADRQVDTYRIAYSTDGKAFDDVATLEASAGSAHRVKGSVRFDMAARSIWVRVELPRDHPSIVLKHFDLRIAFTPEPDSAPAAREADSEADR